jgi:plastocyanin
MPGYAYGTQPVPGYAYGTPPQPLPGGYGTPPPYGTPPQPMPGSSSAYAPPAPMPGVPGQPGQPGQPGLPPGASATVNASDDAFEPKTLTIRPGTVVTWTNRGQHPHTVTFPDVNRDSGEVAPGGTFTAVFPYAGTYNYHCRLHPNMTGTITISQDATPTPIPGTQPPRTTGAPDRDQPTTTIPGTTDRPGTPTRPIKDRN